MMHSLWTVITVYLYQEELKWDTSHLLVWLYVEIFFLSICIFFDHSVFIESNRARYFISHSEIFGNGSFCIKNKCSTVVTLRDLRDAKEIHRVNARWQARSLTQIWQLLKLVILIILSLYTWSFFLSCAESPQILSWTAL